MHSGDSPTGPVLSWRVNRQLPIAKLVGAALVTVLGLLVGRSDPTQWGLAALAAVALVGWAARDLVAPVRLTGDPAGVTVVTGFAGRQRLTWGQIERIRVDRRQRLGLASELLEIDTGRTIHLFSEYDLGAAPSAVAEELATLRTGG